MSYCPTNPCLNCIQAKPINICLATLTVTGLNPAVTVQLRFTSQEDGVALYAQGLTDANGVLTIAAAGMPPLVAGVDYRLTAMGYDLCYVVRFEHRIDANGFITGTNETVEPCS
jgi:hypothetical protein